MALRTSAQIKEYLQKDKIKRLRIREKEKLRQLRLLDEQLQAKQRNEIRRKKKEEQIKKENEKIQREYQIKKLREPLPIYNSTLVDRFPKDTEIYLTREEIQQDTSGVINWTKWDIIVKQTREKLSS